MTPRGFEQPSESPTNTRIIDPRGNKSGNTGEPDLLAALADADLPPAIRAAIEALLRTVH